MLKKFCILMSILLIPLYGISDVLLWTIDDSSFVDSNPMATFVSPLPDDEDNWVVGRVKVTTGSGIVKYLDLYAADGDINVVGETYPGSEGVWIGGGGDFFGAEWNQGLLTSDIDSTAVFAIEIGINHWIDDGTEEGKINFELLAITDPHTYDQLQDFMYPSHDLNPLTATPWNPTYYYTTPEPSAFLLALVGASLLLLKRK